MAPVILLAALAAWMWLVGASVIFATIRDDRDGFWVVALMAVFWPPVVTVAAIQAAARWARRAR